MIRRRPWPVGGGRPERRASRLSIGSRRLSPWAVAAAMVAGGVLLFLGQSTVRAVEARIAALLLGGVQLAQASTLDTNVLFRLRGAFVGLNVTASCSAALLVP